MGWIRKVNRRDGVENSGKTELGRRNPERVDWLPWSLHSVAGAPSCGAEEKAGPPGRDDRRTRTVGQTESSKRVSEGDTEVELMPERKWRAVAKASVCNGNWEKKIGKRPAIRMGSKYIASSEERWVRNNCSEASSTYLHRKYLRSAWQ